MTYAASLRYVLISDTHQYLLETVSVYLLMITYGMIFANFSSESKD